jgi:hypothetical protein
MEMGVEIVRQFTDAFTDLVREDRGTRKLEKGVFFERVPDHATAPSLSFERVRDVITPMSDLDTAAAAAASPLDGVITSSKHGLASPSRQREGSVFVVRTESATGGNFGSPLKGVDNGDQDQDDRKVMNVDAPKDGGEMEGGEDGGHVDNPKTRISFLAEEVRIGYTKPKPKSKPLEPMDDEDFVIWRKR